MLTLLALLGAAVGQSTPNVVFILADDMGFGDPGCNNPESRVPTPHIDRIANEGVRLTDAHSPSAVCTPTRYGVLTGRYCWRSRMKRGVGNGYSPLLIEPGRVTVASMLKGKGYHTACVGKWHLGLGNRQRTDYSKPLRPGPLEVGFDEFFGIPASLDMAPYCFVRGHAPTRPFLEEIPGSKQVRAGGRGFWRKGPIAEGFRHVDVQPKLVEESVSYIERRKDSTQPFFLYVPLASPHTPWLPTGPYKDKAKGAGVYGDFAHMVDAGVGAILGALERTNKLDQTLVIFTSDNGAHWTPGDKKKFPHRANAAWRGQKADIWEGGHRVPFVARWPGRIKPGRVSDHPTCHTDLFMTLANLVGAKVHEDTAEDSFDMAPALFGAEVSQPRRSVVHHSVSGRFAIRDGRWKLIPSLGSGGFSNPRNRKPREGGPQGQLYDLKADPAESKNLWKERPETVARLTELLGGIKKTGRSR